jgi:DNA polymerase-1
MAINTPIQGTAADIIKRAMIKIDEKIKKSESDIKLLLQVHDELIFEIKKDKVEEFKKIITKIMQSNSNLEVPMVVKTSQGSSWKDLK